MVKERRFKSTVSKLTKEKKEALLSKNPLVDSDFSILVNKVTVEGVYKVGLDGVMLPVENKLEKDEFVKLYIKAENRVMVSRLRNNSQRLYLHILYELESGFDYIEINVGRFMLENNISSINTYKSSLSELCRYLFVYPSLVKGVYWINPRLFFCGSRVNKYPDKVIVK